MTKHDEKTIAQKIVDQREKVANEQTILAALNAQMADAIHERESQRLAAAEKVYQEAQTFSDAKAQALSAAKAEDQGLRDRWKQGDESVSAEAVRKAELEIERATGIYNASKKPLAAAKAALDLELTDNLLARRAVEVFTKHAHELPGYFVTYSKDPDYTPALMPAVVFSQIENTRNADRAVKSGSIEVRVFGDRPLSPETVVEVFSAEGCEVELEGNTLTFRTAAWDVPILSAPSIPRCREWAIEAAKLWRSSVHEIRWGNGGGVTQARITDVGSVCRGVTFTESGQGQGVLSVTIEGYYDGEANEANALRTMREIVDPIVGSTDFGLIERANVSVEYEAGKSRGVVMGGTFSARDLTRDGDAEHTFTFTIDLAVSYVPLETA